jgi:hypothetical protein
VIFVGDRRTDRRYLEIRASPYAERAQTTLWSEPSGDTPPRHIPRAKLFRALPCVPSGLVVCAGHRRTRTNESHVSDKLASKSFMSSSSGRTGLGSLRAILRKFYRSGEQI